MLYRLCNISIHAPAKGATTKVYIVSNIALTISIHAPAKGATYSNLYFISKFVFQSTLPRRERPASSAFVPLLANFNPRSREGSDISMFLYCAIAGISIHAPAKGATPFSFAQSFNSSYFNPRSREGSDGGAQGFYLAPQNFNPRSREGSDFLQCANCLCNVDFNPRSREGSDLYGQGKTMALTISIHAPAKGATEKYGLKAMQGMISIHAPAKGATTKLRKYDVDDYISIHAPAKGATYWFSYR